MLAALQLSNFRNFSDCEIALPPGATLFWGKNGQGKTNLLEAVYYLSSLRSFRQATGAQLIRRGAEGFEIRGNLAKPEGEELLIRHDAERKRQLLINGNTVPRAVEFAGRLHAVILHPADLKLVRGRHSERLRWLDFGIAQIEPAYLHELARFQRFLKLRNAALKQSSPARELDALTENFASSSQIIVERRARSWPALRDMVGQTYGSLSRGVEQFSASYESDVDDRFGEKLAALEDKERELQTTITGPHRDRLRVELGGLDTSDSSSEGQARSLALALKIAQARFIRDRLGRPPVLLIDDVWNELDEARRKGLEELMAESPQILLTSTDVSYQGIPATANAATAWRVSGGKLTKQRPE